VRQTCLEIPGGMIDPQDASPAAAAARELEEETGYVAAELVHLGTVQANPAIQNNLCHTYLALDARPAGQQNFDPTELIELELRSIDETFSLLRDGTIGHSLVVAAFAHYLLHQQSNTVE
jgi:8-oxo-dGTP pyrophosphatase MutT (NUDIX family)